MQTREGAGRSEIQQSGFPREREMVDKVIVSLVCEEQMFDMEDILWLVILFRNSNLH